uniref:Preprocorazonin2/preprogonadotropin release hormone-like 2 n=1 Tax=Platynereis dumerilii TaxID=6359 RepID=A0A6B9MF54_PLADU|nr:preprocorazonin2/preprogonadotropin release hormone-like 2 [Platynereis dumerilii]
MRFCVIALVLVAMTALTSAQHAHFSTGWTPGFGIGKRMEGEPCNTKALESLQKLQAFTNIELRRLSKNCEKFEESSLL